MKYEIIENQETNTKIIKRTSKEGQIHWIPFDESNSDYQEYLKSLEDSE